MYFIIEMYFILRQDKVHFLIQKRSISIIYKVHFGKKY